MALATSSFYMYTGGILFDLSINTFDGINYVYDKGVNTGFHSFNKYVEYILTNR